MKLKTIKYVGLALAFGVGFTMAADASITYEWVQTGSSTTGSSPTAYPGGITSAGKIVVDGTSVTSGTWNETLDGVASDMINNWTSVTVAPGVGSDVILTGNSSNGGVFSIGWFPATLSYFNSAQLTFASGGQGGAADDAYVYGNWVPVPEPSTIVAGAMLLLPFGASTLRSLRKNRTV